MKTLTLILAASLILSSCTQKNEISQCPTQLVTSNEHGCICKYLAKKNNRNENLKSKNGLIFMKLKIKQY